MARKEIPTNIRRRLYAECMGRCMNPNCKAPLFIGDGDNIEKAHIDPYSDTADNSFENLVVLCPTCHNNFDKNHLYSPQDVLNWKKIRQEEVEKFFTTKYPSFSQMKEIVVPLLKENQLIFENYYLGENKGLWDKFENIIIINNKKLSMIFETNLDLFQDNTNKEHSNKKVIEEFLIHAKEFEITRSDEEKNRQVLFPNKVLSIFGLASSENYIIPLTEALEDLIKKLQREGSYCGVELGCDEPKLYYMENGKEETLYLNNPLQFRQVLNDYNSFKQYKVHFKSLNFALSYLNSRGVQYSFVSDDCLRIIKIKGKKIIFVYEYCLSKAFLLDMMPEENTVIVNLHNWNDTLNISTEAYEFADTLNVKLLNMKDYYRYVTRI